MKEIVYDSQMQVQDNVFKYHVSFSLQPKATGEHKTKPTQNSIRELRGLGLYPDMVTKLLVVAHELKKKRIFSIFDCDILNVFVAHTN